MADRCEKGLCFNCHQKYSRSHRCPARFLLLIADVDDTTAEANPTFHEWVLDAGIVPQPVDNSENQAQISLHALSGTRASETLRLRGYIATHPICVLVDGGSTHNFIQKQVAHALGLAQSPTTPLKVLVGSGEELACVSVCPAVDLSIQGHSFHVDLYVLDMGGSDVVLGAQWLKQLGPILMDYQALTMKFVHHQTVIELKGELGSQLASISLHQLKRVARTDNTAQIFSLTVCPASVSSSPPTHPNPQVQNLLTSYPSLFTEPSSLPPQRRTDHAISLFPNSHPVNVRPYRCLIYNRSLQFWTTINSS